MRASNSAEQETGWFLRRRFHRRWSVVSCPNDFQGRVNNALNPQHGYDSLLLTAGGRPASDGRLVAKAHIAPESRTSRKLRHYRLDCRFCRLPPPWPRMGGRFAQCSRTFEPPFSEVPGAAAETGGVLLRAASRHTAERFQQAMDEPWIRVQIGLASFTDHHHTAVAVHDDPLPTLNTAGGHARPQHRGHTVLPRHNGAVTQRASNICNDA